MDKLITIFKVPELRRKILFTCLLLGDLPDWLLRPVADRQPERS